MPDYYAILELSHTCSQQEIRRKYRQLAMYRILGDSTRRREFDLANRKKPFTGKTTSRQKTQTKQNTAKKARTAKPPPATRPSFITLLRRTLRDHPITRTDEFFTRGKKMATAVSNSLQKSTQHLRQHSKNARQGISKLRKNISSTTAKMGKRRKKRSTAAFFRGRAAKKSVLKNQPDSSYQRGELDIIYTTPLTRTELKKGKKISVRIANGYAKDGYELLDITIPPASRDGQRLRIRGHGHTCGRNGKRGDLYLHLEERR